MKMKYLPLILLTLAILFSPLSAQELSTREKRDFYVTQATKYIQKGDEGNGLKYLKKLKDVDPEKSREMQIELYMSQISFSLKKGNHKKALSFMKIVKSMTSDLPINFYYFSGASLHKTGNLTDARSDLMKYITGTGDSGKYYSLVKYASQARAAVKRPSVPEGMITIPAGEFDMGSYSGDSDEKPVHRVYLDSFHLDKYEVTVDQYRQCYNSGSCRSPDTLRYCNWLESGKGSHPVNCVNWNDADFYCRYINKRLPTEAEWEKAATWKNGSKYTYPSGKSTVSCQDAVFSEGGNGCGRNRTWPVGSKSEEINGTYDMAGNVWEWVSDWYGSYSGGTQRNPTGAYSGSDHVYRGGSWHYGAQLLRGSNRGINNPSYRVYGLGFRCAASP